MAHFYPGSWPTFSPAFTPEKKQAVRAAMGSYRVLRIDRHTHEPYAMVRAALFGKFAPLNQRNRIRSHRSEDLIDRTTGKELGIQENDLWIVAVALQYDLRFATADRAGGMQRILEAAAYIQKTDFWDPPASVS